MRLHPFPLFALVASAAFVARAELTYFLYDLDVPGAAPTPVNVTTEALKGDAFRQPSKMLFVRDSSLNAPYYMGVYEVTKGQAERLGWPITLGDIHPERAAYAFRGSQFVYETDAWGQHPSLQIPSPEQWLLYAETPEKPCNLPGGEPNAWGEPYLPQEWLTAANQGRVSTHGLLDAYGNVAEYASDGNYYGGCATITNSRGFNFYAANAGFAQTARDIMEDSGTKGNPFQGVRLIYVPPEEIAHTVRTTLDGRTMETLAAKVGDPVALKWPAPTTGCRRMVRTVTPEGLNFMYDQAERSFFNMPAEDVTLAFEQKAVVTVSVSEEGGGGTVTFVRKAPPESFDRLPPNEAYVGETLTLTASPKASWRVREWRDAEGAPIAAAGAGTQWDFTIPEEATPGGALAFTAVFERPTYDVSVTLDGEPVAGWPKAYGEGDRVTVEPPAVGEGYRLSGGAISGVKELVPSLTGPTAFAMPANAVTVAYVSAGYVNIRTVGGCAAPAQPLIGEAVTLTASTPKYKVFKQWTGEATSGEATFSYWVPHTAKPGETLTFTVAYDMLPRVLVTGGSAILRQGTGEAFGEGYYAEGSVLSLKAAAAPKGYAFMRWDASGGGLDGETFVVSSALRNQTVMLTAVYAVDSEYPLPNDNVTRIGADKDGAGAAPAVTLGWMADSKPASRKILGNSFEHYTSHEPTEAYAVLDLGSKTTVYQDSCANDAANKTAALVLKRIRPSAGTWYPSGDTYYLGVFETTVGHFKALKVPMGNAASTGKGDTYPYVFKEPERPDAFIDALNKAFGLSATRPSAAQVENVTKAGLKKGAENTADTAKAFNGAGYFTENGSRGDGYWQGTTVKRRVTESMIVHEGDNASTACRPVGSKLPDPYGFYDLWGNALEWLSDNKGYGGRAGLSLTAFSRHFNLSGEKGSDTDSGWDATGVRGAIRPAVVVPKKVGVTINNAGETINAWEVLPNQKVRLAPQVRAGYDFMGWSADIDGMTPQEQSDGYWLATVTGDVTFTANYTAKSPLKVIYNGCVGPSEALPGQTITVYAAQPNGGALLSLSVNPKSAATADTENGTVTFTAGAAGAITVTAKYETPKAGHRLRLR